METITKDTILVLTHGMYSDRGFSGPFRVLKDLDLKEQEKLFRKHWNTLSDEERDYVDEPDYHEFIGFLFVNNFIEDIDCLEAHLGEYGSLNIKPPRNRDKNGD